MVHLGEGDAVGALALSQSDHALVFHAMLLCARVKTHCAFDEWFRLAAQPLLRHAAWISCMGRLNGEGYEAIRLLRSGIPESYFSGMRAQSSNAITSPLFSNWLNEQRPQIYSASAHVLERSAWERNFAAHGLINVIAHGQVDATSRMISFFCFVNIDEELGERQSQLVELLVPHLHAALCRISGSEAIVIAPEGLKRVKLTARELEVLRLIRAGKTNHEMASLTHKSVFTINNHVAKILFKLDVSNRTHAVAKAGQLGLIEA